MNKAQFWNIDNVSSFRGHEVVNGEVEISNSDYCDFLDEIYHEIKIGNMTYNPGTVLEAVDPVAFNCGKGDYESELQSELEQQLENEDSDNIKFIEGDEFELEEEQPFFTVTVTDQMSGKVKQVSIQADNAEDAENSVNKLVYLVHAGKTVKEFE